MGFSTVDAFLPLPPPSCPPDETEERSMEEGRWPIQGPGWAQTGRMRHEYAMARAIHGDELAHDGNHVDY